MKWFSFAALCAACVAANTEAAARSRSASVAIMPYAESAHFELVTAPGQISEITLEPGEHLQSIAAGDTARWIISDTLSGTGQDEKAHVLIKPFSAGLSTNLLIMTDRRVYRIYVTSREGRGMSGLRWTYPDNGLIRKIEGRSFARPEAAISSGIAVERLNFSYAISGDDVTWRPLRAFDDGRQTWIEFSDGLGQGEAPPLFIVGEAGEPELVNYRVKGRYYIVDRLFTAAELRMGSEPQKIVKIARQASSTPRKGERR